VFDDVGHIPPVAVMFPPDANDVPEIEFKDAMGPTTLRLLPICVPPDTLSVFEHVTAPETATFELKAAMPVTVRVFDAPTAPRNDEDPDATKGPATEALEFMIVEPKTVSPEFRLEVPATTRLLEVAKGPAIETFELKAAVPATETLEFKNAELAIVRVLYATNAPATDKSELKVVVPATCSDEVVLKGQPNAPTRNVPLVIWDAGRAGIFETFAMVAKLLVFTVKFDVTIFCAISVPANLADARLSLDSSSHAPFE
jgi:hypothetical protein